MIWSCGESEKRRPSRSSIRTLNHLHIKDGVGRIQITFPPPLPQRPTPIPDRPAIQTIYDGCGRDTNGQHDAKASGSSRAHDPREVRCGHSYHPQRRSTCARAQAHPDTTADPLVFQTSVNTSPTVTSAGRSSRGSTDPLVLPFDRTLSKLLNQMQVALSLPRNTHIYSPMADISSKPNNSWTGNAVLRDSAMVPGNY